jgi:hypothetical protein
MRNLSAECQRYLEEGVTLSSELLRFYRILNRMDVSDSGAREKLPSQTDRDRDPGTHTLLQVYTSVALLSLSRMFADPLWLTQSGMDALDTNSLLFKLDQPTIDTQVGLTLYQIENRVAASETLGTSCHWNQNPCSVLEAVLYLPALATLALEAHCSSLRERVSRLLSAIEMAGFVFASLEHRDIQLAWSLTGGDGTSH